MTFTSYDHEIGGTGNDYIEWFNTTQFLPWRGEGDVLFACYGVRPKKKFPKEGDTLYCQFKRSFMLFKFMKVEESGEQANTFFAEVRPIKQIIKEGEEGNVSKLILL